jgi:hypothetical protein
MTSPERINMRQRLLVISLVAPALFAAACNRPAAEAGSQHQVVVAGEPPPAEAESPRTAAEAKGEAALKAIDGGTYRFPEDDAGKILARVLPPQPPAPLAPPSRGGPRAGGQPGVIVDPPLPSPVNALTPPRAPQPPRVAPRPTALPERVPADLAQIEADKPERIALPVGALTRLETPDVKQPATLPVLARPTADRAPLEDPTTEFTAASIISDRLPLRTNATPFVKVTVPDPFEYAGQVKIKVAVPEDPLTAIGNPPPPKP